MVELTDLMTNSDVRTMFWSGLNQRKVHIDTCTCNLNDVIHKDQFRKLTCSHSERKLHTYNINWSLSLFLQKKCNTICKMTHRQWRQLTARMIELTDLMTTSDVRTMFWSDLNQGKVHITQTCLCNILRLFMAVKMIIFR